MRNMDDPYKVLGVSPSASDEEITKAYRRMAKKCHPDLNPGDKYADQKMRQVNAAYEQIKSLKNGGASYEHSDGSYGPQRQSQPGGYTYRGDDPFGGFDFGDIFGNIFGQAWYQQRGGQSGSGAMQQARLFVQTQQYSSALQALSQMRERNAEWYYLSAIANAGIGNRITALNHANEAVRMEPDNAGYRQLLGQLQQGTYTYRQTGQRQGFDMQSMGRGFLQMMLAQMVCFFCCRFC